MIAKRAMTLACLVGLVISTGIASAGPATPPPEEPSFDCPVTQPNGVQPPESANVFGRGSGDYANDYLWTSLWIWGEQQIGIPPGDAHIGESGSIVDLKWAWYRFVEGDLTIIGHRLDAAAKPLAAWVPDGYGESGFQVSSLTFPTTGCWEMTGHVGEGSLTFVVEVKIIEPFVCPVTGPNNVNPPDHSGGGGFGNEALWTNLWMWGEEGVILSATDSHVSESGAIEGLKWAWFRFENGRLTITGHHLDGEAPPLIGEVPGGYGTWGFQVSGITFPTSGCWEVTGSLDTGGSLTFVVEVQITGQATPVATPV